jgi:hypothetical protein
MLRRAWRAAILGVGKVQLPVCGGNEQQSKKLKQDNTAELEGSEEREREKAARAAGVV